MLGEREELHTHLAGIEGTTSRKPEGSEDGEMEKREERGQENRQA
jgi:hypothetical protein